MLTISRLIIAAGTCLLVFCGQCQAQTTKSVRERAREQYNLGHRYQHQKQLDRALAHFTAAIELDPGFAEAYFSRSGLFSDKQDLVSAVADLSDCLQLRPNDYASLFNRGLLHERLRKWDEAIADYSRALAPDCDFSRFGSSKEKGMAHAYHYRGRVYHWHKRDFDKAVACPCGKRA